jgi:hypothetical protein
MACLPSRRVVEVEGDGEIHARGNGKGERVGEHFRAGWDGDGGAAGEGDDSVCRDVDCCWASGPGQMNRGEVDGLGSEGV